MKQNKIILCLFLFVFSHNAFCHSELHYGLYFSSHEVIQDKRTSLNLTPLAPLVYSEKFVLEFEANFRRGDGYYGYIFRLLVDDDTNLDLVSNLASPQSNFSLVYKEQTLVTFDWNKMSGIHYNQWVTIKMEVDIETSSVSLSFNNQKKEIKLPESIRTNSFNIIFGATRYKKFVTTDVCPMSLRNIKIFNDSQLSKYWKLSKHVNDRVYDEIDHFEAVVVNPVWLIDKHINWEKVIDFNMEDLMSSAYDQKNQRIFFLNNQLMYCVNLNPFTIDTITYLTNRPYRDRLSQQVIYNEYFDQIWSYDFNTNVINCFDFDTHQWSVSRIQSTQSLHAHHNKLISPIDSSLVCILGYGQYKYSSEVHHYNRESESWEKIDRSEQIEPRYLSGATLIENNKALVFGGYGSKTGYQELSPNFFYDLYQLDLKNFTFEKLWEISAPDAPFVPCQTLVYDKDSACFYTLIYNKAHYHTNLRLGKFNIEDGDYILYNDSIPYDFLDVESKATLFFNKEKTELVAYTTIGTNVSIYSIAYPVLQKNDVLQIPAQKDFSRVFVWLSIAALLLLAAGIFIKIKRKKSEPEPEQVEENVSKRKSINFYTIDRNRASSVFLLGEFSMTDSKGLNITSDFSPTIKQLFLFIFLHSVKNPIGVSISKLDDVLWYDKTGKSARNNRNVNINKLKTILENIDIELVNKNLSWRVELADHVYCDYIEIMKIVDKSKTGDLKDDEIYQLLGLLSQGEMLPNVNVDWIDPFKADFADNMIDCLIELMNKSKYENPLKYHIANAILSLDSVNEEALEVKCRILFNTGKRAIAKITYDSFCKEYKIMFNLDYKRSLEEILNTR